MTKAFILVTIFGIIFSGVTIVHATQSHPVSQVLPATIVIPTPSMLQLINVERVKDGDQPLTVNQDLVESATAKACDMRDKEYFDHKDPQGNAPWHFFKEAGYIYEVAGENLAIGYDNPVEAMNALMNSPKHRDNILGDDYTEVGIGYCGDYTVQHFGKPYD